MGKGSSAPPPPDPVKTAQAQTATNVSTAVANQALQNQSQVTPYGSITYRQTGSQQIYDPTTQSMVNVPTTTATQRLSPREQALYNAQNTAGTNMARLAGQQSARLGSILGRPVDMSKAPAAGAAKINGVSSEYMPEMQDSYDIASRGRVEQALMSRMNPALDRAREQRVAQLSNQGIKIGTEAFDRAMEQENQRGNDAQMQAILAGGQEQSRLTGLNRDQAMFGNDARQQAFQNQMTRTGFNNTAAQQRFQNANTSRGQYLNEQYAQRNQPINEIAALLGTGQVTNPMGVGGQQPQMPTVDYAGLVNTNYNQRLNNWQTQQANNPMNGVMGGLFGLGSAAIMASDERLKQDIEPVGAEVEGNPVYEYSYKGDPDTRHVGVMAQDVLRTKPEAVVPMGKYLAVDYRKLRV